MNNDKLVIDRIISSGDGYSQVHLAAGSFARLNPNKAGDKAVPFTDGGTTEAGEIVRVYNYDGAELISLFNPATIRSKMYVKDSVAQECYDASLARTKPVAKLPFNTSKFVAVKA